MSYPRSVTESIDDPFARMQSLRTFGVPLRIPVRPHGEACQNLIEKALRDWGADRDRAVAYVSRASRFPYDHEEQAFPVIWEAHMILFNAVTDAAEQADIDDADWLDVALTVLHEADGFGRIDLADVLRTLVQDWKLSRREVTMITSACAPVPQPEDPMEPELSIDVVVERALSIVAVTARYRTEMSDPHGT